MKHLFSPFRIRNLEFHNRIVMPALASFLIENDGSVTDRTVEHYRRRAGGGPAMVIMEACAVSAEGVVSQHQARIHEDRLVEGISRIARVIKSEGAVPAVQMHHAGRQTSIKVIKQRPFAPSPLPCPTITGDVEVLSIEGVRKIIQKFGDAAVRAVQAGFELIEIHGAHGYLINQFLSRFSNIREDQYGGDVVGRARFAKEIVREIRNRIGKDFPLSFKISAQEFVPEGLDTDESIEILKEVVSEGVDIVQVSAGNDATAEWICQPMFMKQACLADSAAKIKAAFDMPIMVVGRINDPLVADALIAENKADIVCIGRGLLADPEMPKKAKQGRLDDIRRCIACNTCMESIFRRGRVECLVNPSLGREKEMGYSPADPAKKIMVIGGGPGGMNAAWVAAKRGHDVHLFEKNAALGGQLIMGSVSSFKKELLSFIKYQEIQIKKYGVKCHMNSEAGLDIVKKLNPDVVVLATGSVPLMPPVPGLDKPIIIPLAAVFDGHNPLRRQTVVIGGGAIGCEAALHLSESQCPVTVVEQLPRIGGELESITKKVLIRRLKENRVRIMTGSRLTRVDNRGVFVQDRDGNEVFIESETVVMAIGNRPENGLYEPIKSLGIETHKVGDCLEPRSAKAAIYEGAVIGRTI
jgi:2,4-dienoyl-CoA reductase-like NADH-dependent reductase (Old Yellow Enzyme family)/thioredoxin reductase